MCLKPILIKNVNYGNSSKLSCYSDTTAQYIQVPCGRCSVCLALKQEYLVQRVQMESLSHDLYFLTLTYNNESLPVIEKGEFKLPYVDISDWQKMLKMIRKHEDLPPLKYFLVTEYGGRRHRPHIHAILSFPKLLSQSNNVRYSFELKLNKIFLRYWRRNIGTCRVPIWIPLCTYVRTNKSRNFDLHFLDPNSTKDGLSDVAFYASKYQLKYDNWLDKLKSKLFFSLSEVDFNEVWNLLRPRRLISKGFGSPRDPKVIDHINKGINFSLTDQTAMFPYYINPVTGQTFPLSPYYSDKFLTFADLDIFNSRKPRLSSEDMMLDTTPLYTPDEVLRKEAKFSVVRDFLDNRHTYFDDDFTFNSLVPIDYGNSEKTPFMDSVFADCWQDFESDHDYPDDRCDDLL